jgi:GGDEF domain-containing protein
MISIRSSVDELQKCYDARDVALDCYQLAIRNIAQYSVDLEPEITLPHRKYLEELAAELVAPTPTILNESRATLRGLLRDYRDKSAQYLITLREELSSTARTLQEILDGLGQTDGDHETQIRSALNKLRGLPDAPAGQIRETVLGAVKTIEHSLEDVRKQHQLTVSQFLIEIRMLHKRIDGLESAASVDSLTRLFNREQMELKIRAEHFGPYCLLLLKVGGFRLTEIHHSREVAGELAGAFTKRLSNSLPTGTVVGRWSHEEFIAILDVEKAEAQAVAKRIAEHLTGPYSCLKDGKTVRPSLQLRLAVVEYGSDSPTRVLERVGEFLSGG